MQATFEQKRKGAAPAHPEDRPAARSIRRGLLGRCPACGEGRLFASFLKPVDACSVCGEEMHHHRADDLPPYLVITIVGHLVLGGYMMTDLISSKQNARQMISEVVLGLLLLLAVWIILNQINPDLLNLNILRSAGATQ